MKVHIDIGLIKGNAPVILLCGTVWRDVWGTEDWVHVSHLAELPRASCIGCLDHPDLPIHELKFTALEDA